MSFQWKSHTDIFKGEGIYFLTWAVVNRSPILGTLEPLSVPDADGHIAWVKATEQELARKAAAKGQRYHSFPHDSKRWRMIAGNVMLEMIGKMKQ